MDNARKTGDGTRWPTVISCVVIQLCLGTSYIWSVFQTGIAAKLFGGDNAAAALTFSLMLGMLTFGSTFGGRLQLRIGPAGVIRAGGAVLGAGFLLASFATIDAPWILWLGYGVVGGFGMGMIYSTSIATAQKWFPDKRGFITGLIVSSLGFGGVVFTPVARAFIASVGELSTFAWLAVIFVAICMAGSLFVKSPPDGYKPAGWEPPASAQAARGPDFSPRAMAATPQFYLITASLMLACMAGLMAIGFAAPIAVAKGLSASTAAAGVMIVSIFNSFGRLFWGGLSDRIGRKNTLLILLALTAGLILLVIPAGGYAFLVLMAVVGFSYGGFLGVFPSLTADYFGVKNMGMNYGIVMVGFGAGAIVSSYVAGFFKNAAALAGGGTDLARMQPAFVFASLAAAAGLALVALLKPPALGKTR